MKKFGMKDKSHRTGLSTFASRTSPSTNQSLQKSFHLSHAGQNFKIFSPQNEKLKHPTHSPTMDENSTKTMVYIHGGQERQHTTGVWRQWRVTWLIEHLPRINFYGVLTVLCFEIHRYSKHYYDSRSFAKVEQQFNVFCLAENLLYLGH
ncbi:hypothetical protein [Schleiferia thermophila]|nr:hypothetical protein [Schleiferia thermophila]